MTDPVPQVPGYIRVGSGIAIRPLKSLGAEEHAATIRSGGGRRSRGWWAPSVDAAIDSGDPDAQFARLIY
jgi:hypothetical protein